MLYRIEGIDKKTKNPVSTFVVEATDEGDALAKAAERGIRAQRIEIEQETKPSTPTDSERFDDQYGWLRTLAGLYRFLAILTAITSLLYIGWGASILETDSTQGMILIASFAIGGLITVITQLGMSEGIQLLIGMDKKLDELRNVRSEKDIS